MRAELSEHLRVVKGVDEKLSFVVSTFVSLLDDPLARQVRLFPSK